jgi:hypothetical protein
LQLLVPHALTLVLSEQVEPHLWVPALQVKSQATPLQVEVPLKGGVQATHEVVPQVAMDRFDTQAPLQPCEPLLQLNPQDTPSQVAVALPGGVQAEHEVPQELVEVLDTQAAPQRWKPALQVKSHETPLQVAVPLGGGAQAAQEVEPQEFTEVLARH